MMYAHRTYSRWEPWMILAILFLLVTLAEAL